MLQRQVRGPAQFTNRDRLFFIQLYRWFPSVLKAMTIIRPETVVLASCAFSPLLALEISEPGRPPANQYGFAGIDPADELGKCALGRASTATAFFLAPPNGRLTLSLTMSGPAAQRLGNRQRLTRNLAVMSSLTFITRWESLDWVPLTYPDPEVQYGT